MKQVFLRGIKTFLKNTTTTTTAFTPTKKEIEEQCSDCEAQICMILAALI